MYFSKNILFTFFILTSIISFAQVTEVERAYINAQMDYANGLISHVNDNVIFLEGYQTQLNKWAMDTLLGAKDIPVFHFSEFFDYKTIRDNNYSINSTINLDEKLSHLQQEVLIVDSFCMQLRNREGDCFSKKSCYEEKFFYLEQIELTLKGLYNSCYDFSLSCSIVFGKEDLNADQENIKDVIAQSKNILMFMHENKKNWIDSHLDLLADAILDFDEDQYSNDLMIEVNPEIDEATLHQYLLDIKTQAELIYSLGNYYLGSQLNEEEQVDLLNRTILEFNAKESLVWRYNTIFDTNTREYIYYLQEPQYFKTKEIQFVDFLPMRKPTFASSSTVESTLPVNASLNDRVKGVNPLQGTLPNNVIILIDVSSSMLSFGKADALKKSIEEYVGLLRPTDKMSLVSYSGYSSILIEDARSEDKAEVVELLKKARSRGFTDVVRGLKVAYNLANQYYIPGGNNQVIIATDGEFELSTTMYPFIEEKALAGISTSIFHFSGNQETQKLKQLQRMATSGNGEYMLILNQDEAFNALINQAK